MVVCYLVNSSFLYNHERQTLTIYGIEYSLSLFKQWADGGLPINTLFKIVARGDGCLTIGRVGENTEWDKEMMDWKGPNNYRRIILSESEEVD